MPNYFPQGDELRQIVTSHGWTLYELRDKENNEPVDLERRGPAKQYRIGCDYLFLPLKNKGESLEEAANRLLAHGPCLKLGKRKLCFTRIEFNEKYVRVLAPPPLPPGAVIPYKKIIKVFEERFFIG